jgi:8-oxo-dGTP pyrophosphatase MutT (NUDIX family)
MVVKETGALLVLRHPTTAIMREIFEEAGLDGELAYTAMQTRSGSSCWKGQGAPATRWSFCLRLFMPRSAGDRVARQDERLQVGGWLSETTRDYGNHSR